PAAELLELVDSEARVQERSQEGSERKMHCADLGAKAFGVGDAWSRPVAAPGRAVARVQLRHALSGEEDRMRAHEARMAADVDERRVPPEYACGLAHRRSEVVDIDVRLAGHCGVEGLVVEGELCCGSADDLETAAASALEHVLGEVDAHCRPAELCDGLGRQTGPAADVETAALAAAEQPFEDIELVRRERRAEVPVPVGDAVIPRETHAVDASQACSRRRKRVQPLTRKHSALEGKQQTVAKFDASAEANASDGSAVFPSNRLLLSLRLAGP